MRIPLIVSLSGHVLLLVSLWASCGKKITYVNIPQVYEVQLVSMPQMPEAPPEEEIPEVDMETIPPPPEEEKKLKPKPKEAQPKPREQQQNTDKRVLQQPKDQVPGVRSEEDFRYHWYLRLMTDKIRRNWRNPYRAEQDSVLCTIYFKIQRSGAVTDPRVEKSSGISAFDRAALRAVINSSPLPQLPPDYSESQLTVHLDFEYRKQ